MLKNKSIILALRAIFGLDALLVDFEVIGDMPCKDPNKGASEAHHYTKNAIIFKYQNSHYYVTTSGYIHRVTLDQWGNITNQNPMPYGGAFNSPEHKMFFQNVVDG